MECGSSLQIGVIAVLAVVIIILMIVRRKGQS